MLATLVGYLPTVVVAVCATVLAGIGKPVPSELWTLGAVFGGAGLTLHGVSVSNPPPPPPAATPPSVRDPVGAGVGGQ